MTDGFYDRINEFVTRQLSGYKPQKSSDKVIHDPIWGSVLYYGWEIQVIDSPLLQRLRDISQLGSADLTYTAARHSRFEHSLGTAAVAGRMISKLRDIYRDSVDVRITNADIYKIRLTAILHDVGHCFYSHLSEGVYSSMPVFREAYDEVVSALPVKVKPKGHEF
ncbi:MAG: HD domain-containing protein, partial [Eubacteriales bacterium]